jgi:nucleotide-binding universal stress UspA family protein
MMKDRDYIENLAAEIESKGVDAEALLATGDPATEISQAATRENCDLIAMSTHGHKFIGDVIHGSVAHTVRHASHIPVLLVRGNPHGRIGKVE